MTGPSAQTDSDKRRSRTPGTYVVYRGVPLANTEISRSARTREIYEIMKARDEVRG